MTHHRIDSRILADMGDHVLVEHRVVVQTFSFDVPGSPTVTWSIDAALAAVLRGEAVDCPVLPRAYMEHVAHANSYDDAHVSEVDVSEPGIAVEHEHDGATYHVLIDGTHRCVRAFRENREFRAFILPRAVADRCRVTP